MLFVQNEKEANDIPIEEDGDYEIPERAGLFELRRLEHGIYRLLLCVLYEGAGIYEHKVCLFGHIHGDDGPERSQQPFGIDAGLGAAKALGIDTEHTTFGADLDLSTGLACDISFCHENRLSARRPHGSFLHAYSRNA